MLAPMKITFTDGRVVNVEPKTSDGIRFERAYNMPAMKAFGMGEIHMEHLWYFAWIAYARTDEAAGDFDTWMDTVELVEFVEVEPELPLGSAASPGE